jgi:all-trans-8'-apo-beta-carotenal 15,15'-oxygenase
MFTLFTYLLDRQAAYVYAVHMVAATKHAVTESPPDDLYKRLWTEDLPRSHGFEPLRVEGKLPAELRGTLYRNGPGQFGQFGQRYAHPFEGDGAITAVRFGGEGTVSGASQITPTAGLQAERMAGRQLYGFSVPWLRRMRNVFGSSFKNTANTNVIVWQGKLLALMEAGKPTELDPADLSFRGETTLDGCVVSWFSAHPHRVASRNAIYNFGLEFGRKNRLHCYELPDAGAARQLAAIDLAAGLMLHDFIATESHLVFFLSPTRVSLKNIFLQLGGFESMWRWQPELGTEIICVPIDRPGDVVRFTTDAFYQWHFTNAFTRGNELVVDYVRYPDFGSFYELGRVLRDGTPREIGKGRPHRAVIDLTRRTFRSEQTLDRASEFPTIAPGREGREHALSYLALENLTSIGKLDARTNKLSTHTLPSTQRATEPLFVPRPGSTAEDDGWVIALCHDGPSNQAFAAVYDAARLEDGPLARAWFDHQIPITFHGTFAYGLV